MKNANENFVKEGGPCRLPFLGNGKLKLPIISKQPFNNYFHITHRHVEFSHFLSMFEWCLQVNSHSIDWVTVQVEGLVVLGSMLLQVLSRDHIHLALYTIMAFALKGTSKVSNQAI